MATALVTGASRGMGLEYARQLLARGDTVIATARKPSNSQGLTDLAAHYPDQIHCLPLDVSDPESIVACAGSVGEKFQALDLLVNNAGINSRGVPEGQRNVLFGSLEPQGLLKMIQVNAIGPVLVTQALTPMLEQAERPRVVSISSWLGSIGRKSSGGNYGYCGSKATLNMLGRAMAFDLKKRGIVSILVNPGWVQTDMGGSKASLTVEESVGGVLRVVAGLTEEDAGRFLQWDGTDHAW